MNSAALIGTARELMAPGKGLLAVDESPATCNRRFAEWGIAQTEESRRAWRELLLTTAGLGSCISGVILHDETLRQRHADGVPFARGLEAAGMVVGIKVDGGTHALAARAGEKVTEGLDGLRERLQAWSAMGAPFAKWRAVFTIAGRALPSAGCIAANAHALGRCAALCQEAGLLPIVEPEVLMDGDHTLERSAEVSDAILSAVFRELAEQGVLLEGLVLKPAMVLPGSACIDAPGHAAVAHATLQGLLRTVPAAVAGVAFLSGGQDDAAATARLNAMQVRNGDARPLPWPITFSFARALQREAMQAWAGRPDHVAAAQHALMHRARCNHAALVGEYDAAVESV